MQFSMGENLPVFFFFSWHDFIPHLLFISGALRLFENLDFVQPLYNKLLCSIKESAIYFSANVRMLFEIRYVVMSTGFVY